MVKVVAVWLTVVERMAAVVRTMGVDMMTDVETVTDM